MGEKSRWQVEFDALPEWAQKMVRALSGMAGHGFGSPRVPMLSGDGYEEFYIVLKRDTDWFDGFCGMRELADALTAPWPAPTNLPPREEMTTNNIVEMMTAGEDDNAFDQPCYFGHRVNGHAVYCHNDAWPDSPRKCRRNRDDYRHEDCPGFVRNQSSAESSS